MRSYLTLILLSAGLVQAQSKASEWPMYNRDLAGTRYSPLTQINAKNVSKLTLAWSYRLRNAAERAKPRLNFGTFSEATPLVIKGVMFVTAGNRVLALDPDTGKEIWRYQYKGTQVSKRGVAYWPGNQDSPPRILVTAGTKMLALSAQTGQPVPGFGNEGVVEMVVPYDGVPTIYKDIALVGATVGEIPVGSPGD